MSSQVYKEFFDTSVVLVEYINYIIVSTQYRGLCYKSLFLFHKYKYVFSCVVVLFMEIYTPPVYLLVLAATSPYLLMAFCKL